MVFLDSTNQMVFCSVPVPLGCGNRTAFPGRLYDTDVRTVSEKQCRDRVQQHVWSYPTDGIWEVTARQWAKSHVLRPERMLTREEIAVLRKQPPYHRRFPQIQLATRLNGGGHPKRTDFKSGSCR